MPSPCRYVMDDATAAELARIDVDQLHTCADYAVAIGQYARGDLLPHDMTATERKAAMLAFENIEDPEQAFGV